jgi:hypothetical protein
MDRTITNVTDEDILLVNGFVAKANESVVVPAMVANHPAVRMRVKQQRLVDEGVKRRIVATPPKKPQKPKD